MSKVVNVMVHKVVACEVLFVWALPCKSKDFDIDFFKNRAGEKGFKVAFFGEFEMNETLFGLRKKIKQDLRKYDFDKDFKLQLDLIGEKFDRVSFLDCELYIIDDRGERFPVASLAEIESRESVCPFRNLVDDVVRETVVS